jgi:hypothetical protein
MESVWFGAFVNCVTGVRSAHSEQEVVLLSQMRGNVAFSFAPILATD